MLYSEDEISATRPFYNPDTTSIKAPPGQGCPRCGGMVFAAEQQLAKGTVSYSPSTIRIFNKMIYFLRCGIRNALTAPNATVHSTPSWPAMAPIAKFTAVPVTASYLVPKVLVLVMLLL